MWIAIILFVCLFLYFENNLISITRIDIISYDVPAAFAGYKIVHLSDLHSKRFSKEQGILKSKIKDIKPDAIVFTGDLIDSKLEQLEPCMELMRGLVKMAPTFFVTGNHEWGSGKYADLEKQLEGNGIVVLRNTYAKIRKGTDEIDIVGIDDPVAGGRINGDSTASNIREAIKGIEDTEKFKILLAHRPESFPLYSEYGFNLVFAGHAHGGQVRLPFIGGIVAPNQGFFPQYTAGKHEWGNAVMVVSRGLGNSVFPQRVFNRPEIVVVTLLRDKCIPRQGCALEIAHRW